MQRWKKASARYNLEGEFLLPPLAEILEWDHNAGRIHYAYPVVNEHLEFVYEDTLHEEE